MIARIPASELAGSVRSFDDPSVLAVRVPEAVSEGVARAWLRGVYGAKAAWSNDFDGAQFCLGRAWYTHLEEGRAEAYFQGRAEADALVEAACPGLQASLRALAATFLGDDVVPRPSYCGPGVHVFPAAGHAATKGGDLHFDTEGLAPAQLESRAPAYSFVLMLSPAESGGGLRVWDALYEGSDAVGEAMTERPAETIVYEARELVVLSSYRLHQIQPFGGVSDRVSATWHVARARGRFESWF